MIKGINKQMIILRLEGNRLYESACFLVRSDVKAVKDEEKDMLYEANRILSQMDIKKTRGSGKGILRRILVSLLIFLLGSLLGFVLALLM